MLCSRPSPDAAESQEEKKKKRKATATRRGEEWKSFLDGTLGPGGGGMDTVKLILSFVNFGHRGHAMRALSTRATVADLQAQFIRSWLLNARERRDNLEFRAVDIIFGGGARYQDGYLWEEVAPAPAWGPHNSEKGVALAPGLEVLGSPHCSLLRFEMRGGAPVRCNGSRAIVLAAVSEDGVALEHASEELKGDKDVLLAAGK